MVGYEIEEHDNPPDFFLDVILGNVESSRPDIVALNAEEATEALPDAVAVVVDTAERDAKKVSVFVVQCSIYMFILHCKM